LRPIKEVRVLKALRKDALIILVLFSIAIIVGVVMLVQSLYSGSHDEIFRTAISEIVSDPSAWENKTVKVYGVVQTTTVGIIRPFNYWLCDKENQTIRIGLKWLSETGLSGEIVRVIGVVRKGYAWVHPNYPGWWVYFIEAISVHKVS